MARALVGSECTLVLVLEATVRLVWSPPVRSLLVLGYPDVYHAGDHIPEVLEAGPVGLEGMDDRLVHDMRAMGIHPETYRIVVAKGVASPRPAYQPIAGEVILVNTPGVASADLSNFAYHRRRIPLYPFELDATYEPGT